MGLIVRINAHILHMEKDVKGIATVAIPRVMCLQAVEPSQQVFLYLKKNTAV